MLLSTELLQVTGHAGEEEALLDGQESLLLEPSNLSDTLAPESMGL